MSVHLISTLLLYCDWWHFLIGTLQYQLFEQSVNKAYQTNLRITQEIAHNVPDHEYSTCIHSCSLLIGWGKREPVEMVPEPMAVGIILDW